ncbi:hypothetical protein [Vulcanisaeta distributa]|uniref:Uncharacterized protein n=1 Tax=Vulcanisaeta distributa (strain DSM 14429 / JCM 11212 / NBRC 100878 / IC-017) TaxID=572478 RepID=E1QNV6_VULDI|nr:hypothetical protein [Vulcanisaeta distributa]ADN50202.1 hypothetical protein Vdis_0810 [Vulcanisaeta distributa DSM 14429]
MLTLQISAITIAVIVIVATAVILALLYRLGYLGGRRGDKERGETLEQVIPQYKPEQKVQQVQQRQRQGLTTPQEVSAGQGSRVLLVESRPVEIRPLQSPERPIDIERIEKLIRGIENELVQVLKQTSADTVDIIISRINELKNYINQLERQCVVQNPPFIQMGYVPSSLSEFKELFRASFAGLMKGNDIIEYTGELNVNEELVRSVINYNTDFMVIYSGGKYIYLIKYNDYSLILSTEEYLDSVSSGLVRLLFRRFIDEVLKSGS